MSSPADPDPNGASDLDVTTCLRRMADGDEAAAEAMFPVVYDDLRRLARQLMRSQRQDHTLESTGLVHEAWIKLARSGGFETDWSGRAHFFAVAAKAMRHVLVNHARDRNAAKRGGGDAERVPLDETLDAMEVVTGDVVELNDAMERLAMSAPQAAQMVDLRVFAGMTADESAATLQLSPTEAKGTWRFARAWLQRELNWDVG